MDYQTKPSKDKVVPKNGKAEIVPVVFFLRQQIPLSVLFPVLLATGCHFDFFKRLPLLLPIFTGMNITFIRHSKVDFKWKAFYHSRDFDLACGAYDHAPTITSGSLKLSGKSVYISELKRAEETAHAFLIGEKELIRTALLNEIPLNSFIDTSLKLPTIIWMIAGRLQWYFNSSRQAEVREKSKLRISRFLDLLEEKNEDCILIGHGFYFAQMMTEIKKRNASGNTRKRMQNEEIRTFTLPQLPGAGISQFPQ